jgi:hypothetical protein
MNPNGRVENLKKQSSVEARLNGAKGGVKSGEVRRSLKKIKEIIVDIGEEKNEQGQSNRELIARSIVNEAKSGNIKFLELYLRIVDEVPGEEPDWCF